MGGRTYSTSQVRNRDRVSELQRNRDKGQRKRKHTPSYAVIDDDLWWQQDSAALTDDDGGADGDDHDDVEGDDDSDEEMKDEGESTPETGAATATTPVAQPRRSWLRRSSRKRSAVGAESEVAQTAAPSSSSSSKSVHKSTDVEAVTAWSTIPKQRSDEQKEHDRVIRHFIQYAATDTIDQLDPDAKWTRVKVDEKPESSRKMTFLHELLLAHASLDATDELTPHMWQPYRVQLRSLIQRTNPTRVWSGDLQGEGRNHSLLNVVLYKWTINNRRCVAYEWLTAILSLPNHFIPSRSSIDLRGPNLNPLINWLEDEAIRTDLVFHELMKVATTTLTQEEEEKKRVYRGEDDEDEDEDEARYYANESKASRRDRCSTSFMHDIFYRYGDSGFTDRGESMCSHDYALICFNALFTRQRNCFSRPPQIRNVSNIDELFTKKLEKQIGRYQAARIKVSIKKLLALWNGTIRPQLYSAIVESTSLIPDCAYLCVQYLDGSDRRQIIVPPSPSSQWSGEEEDEEEDEEDDEEDDMHAATEAAAAASFFSSTSSRAAFIPKFTTSPVQDIRHQIAVTVTVAAASTSTPIEGLEAVIMVPSSDVSTIVEPQSKKQKTCSQKE